MRTGHATGRHKTPVKVGLSEDFRTRVRLVRLEGTGEEGLQL